MTLDLSAVASVCAAILGMAAVMVIAGKVLSMLWQWRFGNDLKASQARIEANQERLEEKVDRHLQWHGDPSSRPARPVQQRPNGQRDRR